MESLEAIHSSSAAQHPLLHASTAGVADDPMLSATYGVPGDGPLSPYGATKCRSMANFNECTAAELIDDDGFYSTGGNSGAATARYSVFHDSASDAGGVLSPTLPLRTIRYAAFSGGNTSGCGVDQFDAYVGDVVGERGCAIFADDNLSSSTLHATPCSGNQLQLYDNNFIFSDEMSLPRHLHDGNDVALHGIAGDSLYASSSSCASSCASSAASSTSFYARLHNQYHGASRSVAALDDETIGALLSPTLLDARLASVDDVPNTGADCDSPSASGGALAGTNSIDAPLSATTTSSSSGSNSAIGGVANGAHFIFHQKSVASDVDDSTYGTPLTKRAKFDFDGVSNFVGVSNNSSYDDYTTNANRCYELEALQTQPIVRVITKYKSQLPPVTSCMPPYASVKLEKRYSANGEASSGGACCKYLQNNSNNNKTDDYYDTTSHATDGTVGSSKCSTPSSISSTINSVVVKSLSYSNCSGSASGGDGSGDGNGGGGADSYCTTAYAAYAPRPMNIIVNDMSAHQQPTASTVSHEGHHQFDIKMEQKFDYSLEDSVAAASGVSGGYSSLPHSQSHLLSQYHGHYHAHQQQHHLGGASGASVAPIVGDSCGASELDELNTHELAQRISQELKRYSIPQAIFAQRVLCRSQGTLSDLLRNPKPWSKLKSGRETFRRMAKWLQEPEFQRMSSLRIAACKRKEEQSLPSGISTTTGRIGSVIASGGSSSADVPQPILARLTEAPESNSNTRQPQQQRQTPALQSPKQQQKLLLCREFNENNKQQQRDQCSPQQLNKQQQQHHSQQQNKTFNVTPKKPRLVFTDIQRRTLYAIFKETKRPSREMQLTISQQLNLDPNTVANFFMNARRRGYTHGDSDTDGIAAKASSVSGRASLPVTPPFSSSGSGSGSGSLSPTFSLHAPASWGSGTTLIAPLQPKSLPCASVMLVGEESQIST